jgi:hypothetical protein
MNDSSVCDPEYVQANSFDGAKGLRQRNLPDFFLIRWVSRRSGAQLTRASTVVQAMSQ